jgi:hypothetical protein
MNSDGKLLRSPPDGAKRPVAFVRRSLRSDHGAIDLHKRTSDPDHHHGGEVLDRRIATMRGSPASLGLRMHILACFTSTS